MDDINNVAKNTQFAASAVTAGNLPKFWIGYILAVGLLIQEIFLADYALSEARLYMLLPMLGIALYWVRCVYRLHLVVCGMDANYEVSPSKAAWMHFAPIYNLYWLSHWPAVMGRFIEAKGGKLGVLTDNAAIVMYAGLLCTKFFDSAIGWAIMFYAGGLMSKAVAGVGRQQA